MSLNNLKISDYFFPIEKIDVVNANDKKLDDYYVKNNIPVLIKESNLIEPAVHKWDLAYLKEHLGKSKYNVFRSNTNRFLYWDDKKLNEIKNFEKPNESLQMSFQDFYDIITSNRNDDNFRYYLQQPLNDSADKQIVEDFVRFNWKWITERQLKAQWGELTSNLLLVSQPNNITPCHYDEQENFFAQVRGYKRCLLFSASMFKCLYPYPTYHPCDRQSQVNLNQPDFKNFPKLKELKGYETIVGPGDVLYIPNYWFHQIESLDDITISVNFWYKARSLKAEDVKYPLKDDQKVSMMRNVEKMISAALKNNDEVPEFFESLTLGRYTTK